MKEEGMNRKGTKEEGMNRKGTKEEGRRKGRKELMKIRT
jgi:hypothetical protein